MTTIAAFRLVDYQLPGSFDLVKMIINLFLRFSDLLGKYGSGKHSPIEHSQKFLTNGFGSLLWNNFFHRD